MIAGDVSSLAGFSGSTIEIETFGGLVGATAIYVEETTALAEGNRYLLLSIAHLGEVCCQAATRPQLRKSLGTVTEKKRPGRHT